MTNTIRPEDLLKQGIAYQSNNQFLEAEACFKRVLESEPENAEAIYRLGFLAAAIGDQELAIMFIENAIAIEPKNADFHANLASLLKFSGKNDLAIVSYLEALKLDPDNPDICHNLANLYRENEAFEEAAHLYRKAAQSDPGLASARIHLAETLHNLGRLEEAIDSYRQYLALKPDDVYCRTKLAEACFARGRELEDMALEEDAKEYYAESLSANSTHIASRKKLEYLQASQSSLIHDNVANARIVLVLGMHRSGTSSMTRALQVLGVSLGDKLIPPMQDNEKGFWEDAELLSLNDSMLKAIGSEWHHFKPIDNFDLERLRNQGYFLRAVKLLRQKVSNASIFGFKDPRLAKLLPFWKGVFAHCKYDVSYILAIRNPLSVTDSLARRNHFSAEKSYLMWLEHVIVSWAETLESTRRVVVDFDRLIESPARELNRMAQSLDLQINPDELRKYKGEFLDEGMRHAVYSPDDLLLDESCPPLVRRMYATLLEVASDQTPLDDEALNQFSVDWMNEFNLMKPSLILANDALLNEDKLNRRIAAQDQAIAEKDQAIAEKDQAIAEKDQAIAEREQTIAELKLDEVEKKNELIWMNEKKRVGEAQISALTATMSHGNFDFGIQTARNLFQQGRLKEAFGIAELLQAILKDYKVVTQLLIDLGVAFQNRRDLNMATLAYNKVLQKEPGHAVALHLLGLVLSQQDQLVQAMELIEKSIQLCSPVPLHFLKNAGLISEKLGKSAEAENYYRMAISMEKKFPDAYLCLNALLQSQGRIQEAEQCLIEGLEHVPGNADLGAQLQHLYYKSQSLPHPNS